MMLANLLHEIVRRRLWPIPVVAVLVALAAPLLFMKSASDDAPDAQAAAPPPAAAGDLPARAQRLLAATAGARSRSGASGSARDPFQAPAAHRAASAGAAAGAAGATGATGATGAATGKTSTSSSGATSSTGTTQPHATRPGVGGGSGSQATTTPPATHLTASTASVDVRFGPRAGGRVHRSIPRLQAYYIHGKLAAVFVKYSPSRNRAVFAVSPAVVVSGPVRCRRYDGVCRYVDIPAGSFARLTMLTPDRIVVSRRLDVERIGTRSTTEGTTATAASDHGENACLLRRLQALKVGGAPVDRNACGG